ncbi:hypothetical protein [Chryseobacterium sp.]|uniref:hypothetical protein n=1 Tax=Chryseobacterium sp. TaxID=1871047 RepID=UPI002FCCB12E
MKKILQIVLICISIITFAQKKEIIKLKGNIPNNGDREYSALHVIDQRIDKTIGILPFDDHKETREVVFENSPNDDLGNWYRKSNYKGGKQELILVLKALKLSVNETGNTKNLGTIDFSVQAFAKEGEQYHFLYKKDTVFAFSNKDVSDVMVKNIHHIFSGFLLLTYNKKPYADILTLDEASDYEGYIKNNYEIFRTETLKEGIYLDHISFFKQIPEDGDFVLEKNGHSGGVVRAIAEKDGKKKRISASKMFAYVENGKAYKKVSERFLELNRNKKGFYLLSKPADIFSTNASPFMMMGLAGVLIQSITTERINNDAVKEIYIDPLTGEYDISE